MAYKRITNVGSTTTNLGHFGRAGLPVSLTVVPVFPTDAPDAQQARLTDSTVRSFTVRGRMAKSYAGVKEVIVQFDKEAGESYFLVNDDTVKFRIETGGGVVCEAEFNEKHQMAALAMRCQARNAGEARTVFFTTVRPWLDYLCFLADVPYHIDQLSIVDEVHHVQVVEVVHEEISKVISAGAVQFSFILAPYLAMYREAKNSTSVIYKFLCYYKVLEGVFGGLQATLMKSAAKNRASKAVLAHRVPPPGEFDDYDAEQMTYVGKSVQKFKDEYLTKAYRDAVAHFTLDDGTSLNVSDFAIIDRYAKVLPMLETCCRVTIGNLHTFLAQP